MELARRYDAGPEGGPDKPGFFNECMPEPFVGRMITCVVDGLLTLKNFGAYHGNLKTSNIIVPMNIRDLDTRMVQFKLADYGTTGEVLTTFAERKNAPELGHIAPELFKDNEDNEGYELTIEQRFKADLWSLGICIYQTAYNKHPCGDRKQKDMEMKRDDKTDKVRIDNQNKVKYALYDESPPRLNGVKRHIDNKNVSQYSDELNDLFEKIAKRMPDQRMPLEVILDHPIYAEYSGRNSVRMDVREEMIKWEEGLDSSTFHRFDLASFIWEIVSLKRHAKALRSETYNVQTENNPYMGTEFLIQDETDQYGQPVDVSPYQSQNPSWRAQSHQAAQPRIFDAHSAGF